MQSKSMWRIAAVGLAVVAMLAVPAQAVRERKVASGAVPGDAESGTSIEARRRLDAAMELMQAREIERGIKMLESILEQYPSSRAVYPAALELGRHYLAANEQNKALPLLGRLKALNQPGKELKGDEKEWYLESLYLTGVAYFQMRQFGEAFPALRKITANYSGTVWANQAYYYIGMCHFVQKNWSKAVETLGMVGTVVDPNSPSAEYMESGRRFYVRIEDRDLPLLGRLGRKPQVSVVTTHGDREQIEMVPLAAGGEVMIGSLQTAVGLPKQGDGVLQVLTGDSVTSTYIDEGTEGGGANVPRTNTVKVVSTGALAFKLGDYDQAAVAAYLDDWSHVLLQDADLDITDAADTTEVTVMSRYKKEASSEAILDRKPGEDVVEYATRDQVRVTMTEMGTNAPIHTGRFSGKFKVAGLRGNETPNQSDDILTCKEGDEVVATYTDTLNIDGPVSRTLLVSMPVLGHVDSRPRANQDLVSDPLVLARKNMVEATAYLELARIFRSVGLMKGAKEKVVAGLDRSMDVIRMGNSIPSDQLQEAFKVTWELHIAADDFPNAMSVCSTFNRLFPDSPLVDEALMGMGRIHMENKDYRAAVGMFNQVLGLQRSEAKGEAQFRIGEATELEAEEGGGRGPKGSGLAAAIPAYKLCAERYKDSSFAPQAIAKVIDFYIGNKEFAQANTLLEQVFIDYPDAPFLDSMYLKWTLVAYQSGDYGKALEKCQMLISQYPDSPYAQKAKDILPKIQQKVGGSAAAPAGTESAPSSNN